MRTKLLPGLDVSRETEARLQVFLARLQTWNKTINLIANGSSGQAWDRHILDSAQIWCHIAKPPEVWLDLGSGGGLPGLVCAIIAAEHAPRTQFALVESDTRKTVFLQETARTLDLNVRILRHRIEGLEPFPADMITARALAPLPRLLPLVHPFCHSETQLLLHKGKTVREELTQAQKTWHIQFTDLPSVTDSGGVILKISGVERR